MAAVSLVGMTLALKCIVEINQLHQTSDVQAITFTLRVSCT